MYGFAIYFCFHGGGKCPPFDNLNSYDGGRFRDLVTYPLFDPVGDTTDSYYSPTIQQIENVKNTLDLTATVSFDISQKKQSNKSNKIDYSLYKPYVDEALVRVLIFFMILIMTELKS